MPVNRPRPRRALSEEERAYVLAVLHCERFADLAPATIHAILLDEGSARFAAPKGHPHAAWFETNLAAAPP